MNYWGSWYWPDALIAASVAFLVPELYAVATDVNNTLSDYCWRELHVGRAFEMSQHGLAWWFSLVAWLVFAVVITAHIWWRAT